MNQKEQYFSILQVDDEPKIHSTIKRCLHREPYLIETAEGGYKALKLMNETIYDLYIIDLKMPGIDGITLLKEIIARTLHIQSNRPGNLFLPVDCAGISKDLIESELFGHEKGAFTGATTSYLGLIRSAEGGTLFLDEIGELSLSAQAKLLRFLQEKTIRSVGRAKSNPVNVRIIAATNRDLSKEVKQKTFREDLFYRLNVIVLKAIPLRERIEDIALLSRYFLDRFQSPASPVKTIGREAQEVLINYNWPGNVRELENCIRRAIAIGLHKTIRPSDLPETIKDSFEIQVSKDFSLSSLEKTAIKNALIISKGNRIKAADMLDIGIATLYRKLKKYNLN